MKISVIGLGYIGLPTAIAFAKAGHTVFGYDLNEDTIHILKSGHINIVEDNLQEHFDAAISSGNLIIDGKIKEADAFIVAVPTPLDKDKKSDMSYVYSAAKNIAPYVRKGNYVILESTSRPGTTERMKEIICHEAGLGRDEFYVAHCPERVLPGQIMYELEHNDRIIGVDNPDAEKLVVDLYDSIVKEGNIYTTSCKTAEMCKLVENSFRDVNIAFANELSIMCDNLSVDVNELITLANKHPRVNILNPGVGVGGHCISVDPWFLVEMSDKSRLIHTARKVNDAKPKWVADKLADLMKNDTTKSITIMGLSYKPDIDDLRESPSLIIAHELMNKGFKVYGCEPYTDKKIVDEVCIISLDEVNKSDYVFIAQKHRMFTDLPASIMDKLLDI